MSRAKSHRRKRRQPRRILPVRHVAQLRHECTNRILIHRRILGRPIIFVAETPQNDARMIAMLIDHRRQLVLRHLLPRSVADAAAAPRQLLPHQQPKLIAQLEHQPRLLIVREPDEVRAHLLNHLHLFARHIIRNRRRIPSMVFMPMRSAQQQPLAIQLERPMLDELVSAARRNAHSTCSSHRQQSALRCMCRDADAPATTASHQANPHSPHQLLHQSSARYASTHARPCRSDPRSLQQHLPASTRCPAHTYAATPVPSASDVSASVTVTCSASIATAGTYTSSTCRYSPPYSEKSLEVRRNRIHAARVVAQHCERHTTFVRGHLRQRVGEVDDELVIPALVLDQLFGAERTPSSPGPRPRSAAACARSHTDSSAESTCGTTPVRDSREPPDRSRPWR